MSGAAAAIPAPRVPWTDGAHGDPYGVELPAVRPREGARPPRWIDVDASEALLAEHLSAAVRRFGTAVLGLVDLPAIEAARPSRAELGVAAVLLWARHVDDAGLLDFVTALARGVHTGALPMPLTGPIVRRLVDWQRRGRLERFTAEERRALYERTVGGELDAPFAGLVAALSEIGHAGQRSSIRHLQVRAAQLGRELAGELSGRATGIAAFAARDIVQQVREALALLADPELARALGGGGPWTLIARHAEVLLGRRVDVERHVARAVAGRAIIEWLAGNADRLVAGTPAAGDPVVRAALAYGAEAP
jgi:hypothetical protein